MSAAASTQQTKIRVYKIVVLGDGGVGKSGMRTVDFLWSLCHEMMMVMMMC